MSFVIATPDVLASAASDLASLGSAIGAANAAAGLSTMGVSAAGADEVSAAVAVLFGAHGREYQAVGARAAAFHAQFVQVLSAGAGSYVAAEAASVSPLAALEQAVWGAVNAPTRVLLGRPLIGNGAPGASGPVGQPGGAG
ncbi:PE family protein, partial [Mycobacterium sp. ML5]